MNKDSLSKIFFWTVMVVLISVSLLTYQNLNDYTREVRAIRHSNRIFKTLEVVLSGIKDAETSQRGYQLTRDSSFLEPFDIAVRSVPVELRMLDSLAAQDEEQSKRVDTLEQLAENQFSIISKILTNASKSSLFMDRYERNLIDEGKRNMDDIRRVGGRIRAAEEKLFKEKELSETDLRNIAPIFLFACVLVPMIGLVYLFTRILDGLEKRRKAEERLTENIVELRREGAIREFAQMTLRSVIDNSLDGIMALSAVRNNEKKIEDFSFILANTVSVTRFGLDDQQLVGKKLLTTLPETRTNGLFDHYRQVVDSGVQLQFEYHQLDNGVDKWFHVAVVKLEDGCVVRFSDITERKQKDLLLEERALLLDEAEGLANIGSWKWSEQDNLIWSDGLYRTLRKDKTTYQPSWNSFLENVHPDDVGLVSDFVVGIVDRQEPSKLDYRVLLDEQTHYLSIHVKPVQPDDGQPLYMLGSVVDITERKVYENQLKQYTAELQRSNEDLEQFAYIASHDLQEPLRKIRAFGDRLSTKFHTQLNVTGQDYITRMQSGAARMQSLIEDILAFSKLSKSTGAVEQLDMRKLMDEIVDDLYAQIEREQGTVRVGKLPDVKGDRAQIKRLFQNLISNGLKFHKTGERPLVEVTGKTLKAADALEQFGEPTPDGQCAVFSIKDNGIGFDEKYRDKIFNIFQRLHGRNEFEGTGLGLSICRKIVVNHGGRIVTRSQANVGSEFIVILPIE